MGPHFPFPDPSMSNLHVPEPSPDAVRSFTKALLVDLQALEEMLDQGMIESGVRRFGAEQEAFLVDRTFHPAPSAPEILERLGDSAFTTELARFNLEMNLSPVPLEGSCFSTVHRDIDALLAKAKAARKRK